MARDEFMRQIHDAPDDVNLRLQFADWLEAQGDPQGELIRVQCAINHIQQSTIAYSNLMFGRMRELFERETDLIRTHGSIWRKPFRNLVSRVTFQLGLAQQVAMPASWFIQNSERILQAGIVVEVKLNDVKSCFDEFLAAPHLERIRGLNLDNNSLGARRAQKLFASPRLRQLRTLRMNNNNIASAGIRALAESGIDKLESICLSGNRIDDTSVAELAAWPGLGSVKRLDLSGNEITEKGLAALTTSPHLRALRKLAIGANRFGTTGVQSIAGSTAFPQLRVLEELSVDAQTISTFNESLTGSLHHLALRLVDGDAALALAQSPLLSAMHELELDFQDRVSESLTAIANSDFATTLEYVGLNWSRFTDSAWAAFTSSHGLPSLMGLGLSGCQMGIRRIQDLTASPQIGKLEILYLDSNDLGTEGLKALLRHPLPALRQLELRENGLTTEDVMLFENARIPNLKSLVLRCNNVNLSKVRDKLHAWFPDVEL